MVRPFRFGVMGESVRSGEQLIETARRAEQLGYATFLQRDHFVREPFGDQLAPMVALTAVAAATTTLRIGTLVLSNDYRHPVMLAKEAATLDQLSGGRFELGLGAGWLLDEYEAAGMPFDRPGVRVDRLSESLRVLDELLSGGKCTFTGEHYRVSGLETFPPVGQRPRPPILVGAGSPRMLRLAGRQADIVGILPKATLHGTISEDLAERTSDAMSRKIDLLREGAGDRFDQIELSQMISFTIADDYRAAAERMAAERGWGAYGADVVLDMPSKFVGSVDRIADELRARRERFGFSYLVVSDADMEEFAPVVDLLAGR